MFELSIYFVSEIRSMTKNHFTHALLARVLNRQLVWMLEKRIGQKQIICFVDSLLQSLHNDRHTKHNNKSAVKFGETSQILQNRRSLLNLPAVLTKEKIVPLPVKSIRAGYERILHLFISMANKWKNESWINNYHYIQVWLTGGSQNYLA